MQRYLYKETRVKRTKENGYYSQIEGLKTNSDRYDHLYETVDMMTNKLSKLSRNYKSSTARIKGSTLQNLNRILFSKWKRIWNWRIIFTKRKSL